MFFGVISPADTLTSNSHLCTTSYGWSRYLNQVYIGGMLNNGFGGNFGDYKTGDIVSLQLDCNTQTLTFSIDRLGSKWAIDLPSSGPWMLHLNLRGAQDKVTLLN